MTKDLLFIIIAMLIAAILGYFIGRSSSSSSNEGEDRGQNNRIKDLEAKLRDCENRNRQSNMAAGGSASAISTSSQSSTSQGIAANAPVQNFNSGSASEAMGKKIKPDDLKIVEGIGPKIESILNDNNIKTWKSLADSSADRIREILIDYGGDSYRIHEPNTWPKQARMAFEGRWQELAKYQDRLKGGKEV